MPTTTPAAVAGDADDFVESPAGPDSQDEFSRRLWDEAYEKIKADCPELVAKYEVILTRLLSPEPKDDANENRQREGAPVTEEASTKKLGFFRKGNVLKKQNPTIERNDIEQSVTDEGRAERRAQMHRIADHLMNKTQKTASVEEKAKAALDVATKFRDALTLGFDAIPGGEVAVAAFWTGLEFLNTALDENNAVRDGLQHVKDRTKWYSCLADNLQRSRPGHQADESDQFSSLRESLKDLIVDLYQALLNFLIAAVVHLNKYWLSRTLANSVAWDDWGGSLQQLKDTEDFTDNKIAQFQSTEACIKMGLTSESLRYLIDHVVSVDRDEQMRKLSVGDMHADMADIEARKDEFQKDSFKWILSNEGYKKLTGAIWSAADENKPGGEHINADPASKLLWIRGDPGKGKTMLMIGIIKELTAARETSVNAPNVSFFFCQASNKQSNSAAAVLRGLLWVLCKQNERLKRCLEPIRSHSEDVFRSPSAYHTAQNLFVEALKDRTFTPTYFIVDALDECQDNETNLRSLMTFMSASSQKYPKVKWLVSSRNETHIYDTLEKYSNSTVSLELNAESVGKAVDAYIDYKSEILAHIWHKMRKKDHPVSSMGHEDSEDPEDSQDSPQDSEGSEESDFSDDSESSGHSRGSETSKSLVEKSEEEKELKNVKQLKSLYDKKAAMAKKMKGRAEGTFLWVWLVFKEIKDSPPNDALDFVWAQVPALYSIYQDMMRRTLDSRNRWAKVVKDVLLVLVNAYRPLTIAELAVLADFKPRAYLKHVVRSCGLLTISPESNTVFFVHHTAKEFLTLETDNKDNERWKNTLDSIFKKGHRCGHKMIARRSLEVLRKKLKKNICQFAPDLVGISVDEANSHLMKRRDPLAGLRYSCSHWTGHIIDTAKASLQNLDNLLVDDGRVHEFLKERLLHWFESLSLIRDMARGVAGIAEVSTCVRILHSQLPNRTPALGQLLEDTQRFIFTNRHVLEYYPLQIYASALLFSPKTSTIRRQFAAEFPTWVTVAGSGTDRAWSRRSRVLEAPSKTVRCLTVSRDIESKWIATAYFGRSIKIWERMSAMCVLTINELGSEDAAWHGEVDILAFSNDMKYLAAMQTKGRITIFDTSNGDSAGPIIDTKAMGPRGMVFSSDDSHLLYFNREKLFKRSVDDSNAWELIGLGEASVLADDGSLFLTTGLEEPEIRSWDTHQLQEVGSRLKTDVKDPRSLAVSLDHKLVAVSGYESLYVYDRLQGTQIDHTSASETSMDYVSSFSPDGSQIMGFLHRHNQILVADIAVGRLWPRLRIPSFPFFIPMRFSGDGSQIIYAGPGGVTISEVEEDAGEPELGSAVGLGVTPTFTDVFSVNNGSVIVSLVNMTFRDTAICTWAADTGELIASSLISSLEPLRGLSSTPNQQIMLLKVGVEGTLVDAANLQTVRSLYFDHPLCTLSNNGEMVAAERVEETPDLALWNVSEGVKIFNVTPANHHDKYAGRTITFTKDDKNLISHSRRHIAIWNLKGECEYLDVFDSPVDVLVGDQVVVILDEKTGYLELRDIPNGKLQRKVTIGYPFPREHLVLSPDGEVMAGQKRGDGVIHLFSTAGDGNSLCTLDTGFSTSKLRFDPSGLLLQTERGAITLVGDKGISSYHPAFEGLALSPGYDWVTWKGEKLLFIPPEYRPAIRFHRSMVYIEGMTVAIGRGGGNMVILRFEL